MKKAEKTVQVASQQTDTRSTLGATGQTLFDAGVQYLDQGIGIFLSDPTSGKSLEGKSEFEPISDKSELLDHCKRNPTANLQIVADIKDYNLLAVEIPTEQINNNLPEPLDKLSKNDTLAFEHPDGTRYFLFRGSNAGPLAPSYGVSIIRHTEPFLVFPSIIEGRPVTQISDTSQIITLDNWLENIKTYDPAVSLPQETLGKSQGPPKEEEQEERNHPLPPQISLKPTVEKAVESGNNSMDIFITKQLEAGQTKEATLIAALAHGKQIGVEEPENKVLDRIISISTNINYKETAIDFLLAYILELADYLIYPFIDEHDQPHAFLKDRGLALPMNDKAVARYLKYHHLRIKRELAKAKVINEALEILDTNIRFEGEKITLSNRVAWKDNQIFFDMGDETAIKVTPSGWEIEKTPILFRRFGHQMTQDQPMTGGDAWKLFDYLNVVEEDRLLVLVYVISLFIPDIAHPLFHVWGEHGSAKSFLCTAINQLCDPTSVTKLIANRRDLDLVQNLYKHYVTVYDNLSEITPQMSDIFCQACTGSSFNKRRLYTDSEDVVFRIKHVVILNSIEMLLMRQDLIDRSIILHMKRIPPTRRRREAEVWKGFEDQKALILGGIMDCLTKAMVIFPTIPAMDLPRMADFYQWGYAITEALGLPGEDFVKSFANNITMQNASVRHNNTLCEAVIELMDGRELHDSTVKATLDKLRETAEPKATDPTFPKAPKDLVAYLKQIEPTLAEYGINFEVGKRQGKGTPLVIRQVADIASSGSPASLQSAEEAIISEPGEADEADEAVAEFDDLGWEEVDLSGVTGTAGGL